MALRVERLRINTRDSPFRIRMLTPRAAAWKRRQTARLLEDFNGAVRRDRHQAHPGFKIGHSYLMCRRGHARHERARRWRAVAVCHIQALQLVAAPGERDLDDLGARLECDDGLGDQLVLRGAASLGLDRKAHVAELHARL